MLTFLKLGGSIITDKRGKEVADLPTIGRLSREIGTDWSDHPDERNLLIGHGSGSFGHVYAARYGVHQGLAADSNWMGFALTARAVRRLHGIIIDALLAVGIPALSLQPSATLTSAAGELADWQTTSIERALQQRMVPIIHGDVAFDTIQGSAALSTEALFAHLALHTSLKPDRIILVGETAIHTADPFTTPDASLVPLITRENIGQVLHQAGASRAVDVTGGMLSKLALMWQLVETLPDLEVILISAHPGLLELALRGEIPAESTCIRRTV